MAGYLRELRAILNEQGQDAFLRAVGDPVLVLLGLARELTGGGSGDRTMVASARSEELGVTSLIGRVFPVRGGSAVVTVGRTAESDVSIPEYSISKKHCEFRFRNGTITLRDLGSTNGTEVNGLRLTGNADHLLTGGEVVVLGRFAFRFDTPSTLLSRLSEAAALLAETPARR